MSSDNKLLQVLGSPKTSRRDFIRYAVATGVTATVAGSMFDKARAATPQKRRRLPSGADRRRLQATCLDPAQTNDSYMINVGNQLRNHLTEIAPDGSLRSNSPTKLVESDGREDVGVPCPPGRRVPQWQDRGRQ
jgi:peptide/nickel transport system substrate-binding protein